MCIQRGQTTIIHHFQALGNYILDDSKFAMALKCLTKVAYTTTANK